MAAEDLQDVVTEAIVDGRRCANAWGPLFDHLGSKQVVRDMEALRVALGEAKLNFLGVSYGSRLGSLYAHMYPESAGAIVLDSAMTPDMDLLKDTRESFAQLLVLQGVFFQDCDAGVLDCPADARALFDDLIADATEFDRGGQMAERWASALAYPWSREALPLLLERQALETDPAWINDELSQPGIFDGIAEVANRTVTCIDATAEPPSIAEFTDLYYEFAEQSPLFAYRAYGALQCTGWPVTRDPVPPPNAPTAPPLLVIGGTQDLLTPLSNAEQMAAALGNATLLVSNHYGHGALSNGQNRCVIDAVISYFADGQLPPQGTICDL
jgi:pimeloyl-ACP methyl ester carboxylesterase